MIVAENDANLITNQLIYKLAPEAEGDYSWVRPGKIAWDWYNALILTGVDFKCGINNDTYKYYIDFASKYGIEYVVIDDGWSEAWDVTKTIPEINMELMSLQNQMDKIVRKSKIPLEEGESELLQMIKDTARAIPNSPQFNPNAIPPNPNSPRVE